MLADQVTWCTDLLQPVWRALLAGIIDARVMHLDGTILPVQDSEAAGGKRISEVLEKFCGIRNEAESILFGIEKNRSSPRRVSSRAARRSSTTTT